MAERHIIPVPAANDSDPVVVVEVKQTGPHPLDVRLVGCEGENPYVAYIEHRNIGKLKHKFKGSNEEWEAILSHFLLHKQPERDHASALADVSLVYALNKRSLDISVRQKVHGIKVILGELSLPQDEEFEIDPFEWARISAEAHNSALEEVAKLKAEFGSKQEAIDTLKAQLDDFIKTKNEAETAMLEQFMALLNEKKRKIRDQQRLLAAAKVDEPKAKAIHASREETKPRKAGPSRASKRKAPAKQAEAKQAEAKQESDSDHMEVDEPKEEEEQASESDDAGAATPDRSTDAETEDEDEGPSQAAASTTRASQVASQKETEEKRVKPPTRELPFGRPGTRSKPDPRKQPSPIPAGDDDDDETDDEEL